MSQCQSGKGGNGRKNPYSVTAKKNTDERQRVSEVKATSPVLTSEALRVIGVPPVPIGAKRSKGVSAYTVTF